jgi:Protein of unknown function (DUF2844)
MLRGRIFSLQSSRPALLMLAGIATALCGTPCFASLGRAPSTFAGATTAHPARTLAAATGAARAAGHTVNTTTLASGTTVREYVGTDGIVFAVAWNGPFLPDLRELLGDHFATLTGASAQQRRTGGGVHAAATDVTIESTGHMRAYAGRAWINSRLPAGFDTDAIQ